MRRSQAAVVGSYAATASEFVQYKHMMSCTMLKSSTLDSSIYIHTLQSQHRTGQIPNIQPSCAVSMRGKLIRDS